MRESARRPLIVCCGNADRGDDALGPACADRLEAAGIPVRCLSADAFSLLDLIRGKSHVILVDAVVTGQAPPGAIHRWEAPPPGIVRQGPGASTHGFGLAEALQLAARLNALPGRLSVFGVEAAAFEWGEPLTPAVEAALPALVQSVMEEWNAALPPRKSAASASPSSAPCRASGSGPSSTGSRRKSA
jgi:hydrogenase maturation protease